MNVKHKLSLLTLLCFFLSLSFLQADDSFRVLATNSWTGAFAMAAGVEDLDVLAPADMVHPPEYELRPSDVREIKEADLLVYAGYEVLMKTVFESLERPADSMLKIMTAYSPQTIHSSVMAIAEKSGTVDRAEKKLEEIDAYFRQAEDQLKETGLYGAPVLVHFHQRPLAEALGFQVKGVFGPAPPRAKALMDLAEEDVKLIIDNSHNPLASPLSEMNGAPIVELSNFPSRLERDSLLDMLRDNLNSLIQR